MRGPRTVNRTTWDAERETQAGVVRRTGGADIL